MSERITRINGCKLELLTCTDAEIKAMLLGALERRYAADKEISGLEEDIKRRIGLLDTLLEEAA